MKFLIDNKRFDPKFSEMIAGQLLTPLTNYKNWSPEFYAIDNGAFCGFRRSAFDRLLERQTENKNGCKFVCVPDVVGSARRTLEIWGRRFELVPEGWPLALVAQDGLEDLPIPWDDFACVFIGGTDAFKSASSTMDIIRTARILKKQVHIGRVNSPKRFRLFADVADTCDGSGVSRGLSDQLARIRNDNNHPELF